MAYKRRMSRFVFLLMASTALPTAVSAQEPAGKTLEVTPAADASGVTGARILAAPGDIYQGDSIVTGASGRAQIEFVDDTRFVVGPNSKVTIDKFVFDPDKTARSVALNAAKGTFRFISGKSPKDAYRVNTPTMTLGVRGSAYNLVVLANGQTLVQWVESSGFACAAAEPGGAKTDCIDLKAGDFVSASPGGGFDSFRPGERTHLLTQLFSGFNSQQVLPSFRTPQPTANRGTPETFDRSDVISPSQPGRPSPAPAPAVAATPAGPYQ